MNLCSVCGKQFTKRMYTIVSLLGNRSTFPCCRQCEVSLDSRMDNTRKEMQELVGEKS